MKYLLLLLLPQLAMALPSKELQFKKSFATVIANSTMPDVIPGMVVASPSRENPNYYFDWVRDTALTMRSLIDYYELKKDPKVKRMILTWVNAENTRQTMPSISGLGEPKYNIDGSGFNGPWGRPQNDGPALRAIAAIKFARLLIKEGEVDYVLKNLYHGILPANSLIKRDLEYTSYNWTRPSFDLWEEEQGMHFYTLLAQHTALQEGAKLAHELADFGASEFYKNTSLKIAMELKNFMDDSIGIKVTTYKTAALGYKNSGIDVAPLLALLHNYPYQKLFSFNHPMVRKYIETLKSTFSRIYTINHTYPDLGVAIGRYPEDKYDGYGTNGEGNPWFLTTLALGEYYCLSNNKNFEKQFQRALFHSAKNGEMSEQINRENGYMQGAYELTWSHNAFMTAMMRCGFVK